MMIRGVLSGACVCAASVAMADAPCRLSPQQWSQVKYLATWDEMSEHICKGETSYVTRGGRDWVVMQWVVEREGGITASAIAFDQAGQALEIYTDKAAQKRANGAVYGKFFGEFGAQTLTAKEQSQ